MDSYRLGSLVEAFNLADGLPEGLRPHRATYDALVAARLFVLLATKAASLDELRGQRQGGGDTMSLRPFSDRQRGLFAYVDGPSGAAKSTIVQHLAQLLVAAAPIR